MSTEHYRFYYGAIAYALTQIIGIQNEHDFAMVDERSYRAWLSFDDFRNKKTEDIVCKDGVKRQRFITDFDDGEHKWQVATIRVPHPHHPEREGWHFIEYIAIDGETQSRSKISVEKFCEIAAKKSSR